MNSKPGSVNADVENLKHPEISLQTEFNYVASGGVDSTSKDTLFNRLKDQYWEPNAGIFLLIVSYFFNSVMQVSTKVLETFGDKPDEDRIKPLQILLIRMVITSIGIIVYVYMNRRTIPYVPFGNPQVRQWLILRGIFGFIGVFGMYFSLMYLTISDAVLISFMAPSFTLFLAWFVLGEPFSKLEGVGSILSLTGVLFIVRPSFIFGGSIENEKSHDLSIATGRTRFIATTIALFGAASLSGVYIVIRFIGAKAHAIMNVSYFSVVTGIVSLLGVLFIPSMKFQVPEGSTEWILFCTIGVCGFIHQLLLTMGIQKVRAGKGSLMSYTQVIYAIFWDVTLWGRWPNAWSIFGMFLIIGSTIWVIRLKEQEVSRQSTVLIEEEPLESLELQNKGNLV
ncbi:hypothetical protein Kpol_543p75 [Vanderwaltozyma polyspora DSM 70294]|uniref:EamA domain-containing protein n=1 Tax=Vanderwaltozyma polyspora (strain ATCC 22028 / DSM 70294 / BCRC 21397 / CBS 2163 / NBRC 10782 / NRRL Y-8283 / UCD 57-17) TaxID=436907 RepID=A7THT0_VANPO|nr:uncharacterized protein Kpol_543p75 [Vanderwaltozyma polyspora DSM 70294]EDO18246.1 hypothetical protein Kpol_543p75 [Vanderwaltozyma polyspora DSM 70294]